MKITYDNLTRVFSIQSNFESTLSKYKLISTDRPQWIQSDETPNCPECSGWFNKVPMRFVAQYEVGSKPIKFKNAKKDESSRIIESKGDECTSLGGDSNNMYLFRCPNCNKEIIIDQCY